MSTPTLASDESSQLVSRSYIAEALGAHQRYLDQLQRWYDWLEDETDAPNAHKLMLFKLIEATIARREPGGAWANEDEDVIPTAGDLREMLDETRFAQFRQEIERLRNPIEQAGLELTTILTSTDFLTELDNLPWDEQLIYADRLADQLVSSNVCFLFLRQSVGSAPTTPLPLFSPERLLKPPGDFVRVNTPVVRRAGRIYADVFLKLAPAMLVDADYRTFSLAALDLFGRYFPEDVLDALTFEDKVDDLRIFLKDNPTYLDRFGKPAAASIFVFLELVNVYLAIDMLKKDPGARTTFGVLRAVASLTTALSTAQSVLKLPTMFKLANSRIVGINVLTAVYDLAIAAIDSHSSWRTNDLSVAAGHALQGVGLAGAAAVSTWAALSAAGAVAPSAALNPVAGALLTLGALVVTFGGTFLIVYTQDPPVQRWFENNYFGSNWSSVDADEAPTDILFRWKRVDDSPNIPRQVSEYLSMFFPLRLQARQTESGSVVVTVQPTLGYHESHVVVKRINDEGLFSDPPRYTLIPLYMKPANRIEDDVTACLPADPGDEQRLSDWIRTFTAFELSHQTDPDYDAEGDVIEVDLTIPDKFQPALSGIVMSSPGVMDQFPFVLRARVRVE